MKLEALMDFKLFEEGIDVKKGQEILIGDKPVENEIVITKERAKVVEAATYQGKPLVKKAKPTTKIETADLKTDTETADVKPKRTRRTTK